ncbi:MAG: hypothetical protein IPK53_08530 [bacterium]|nr:hypothetical protein [bacterium]
MCEGTGAFDALTEQLLPDLFRLRLQQVKVMARPSALLLALTWGLSGVFLVLARPDGQSLGQAAGWPLAGLLLALLVWQVGWGRVQLPLLDQAVALTEAVDTAVSPASVRGANTPRLVNDLTAALWTAERLPEKRFVSTAIVGDYPAIVVPAQSALEYALDMPLNGRLRTGVQVDGAGSLAFDVAFNGAVLAHTGRFRRRRPPSGWMWTWPTGRAGRHAAPGHRAAGWHAQRPVADAPTAGEHRLGAGGTAGNGRARRSSVWRGCGVGGLCG